MIGWMSVALAAGLLEQGDLLMAWDDGGVALYERESLDFVRRIPVFGLRPHPAASQPSARVRTAVVWEDSFWVLVGMPGRNWLVQVDGENHRPVRMEDQMGGLAPTDEGLIYVAELGRLVIVEDWSIDDEWAVLEGEHRGVRPLPELRSAGDLKPLGERLVARTAVGLVVIEARIEGPGVVANTIVGSSSQAISDFGVLPSERLVSLGKGKNGSTPIERWSLYSEDAPWPFALGERQVPGLSQGLVQLPDGIWIMSSEEAEEVLPGVLFGGAAANHQGGAVIDGRLLLVDRALRLHEWELPTLHPEVASQAFEGAISEAIRAEDLPMGGDNAPGGSMPVYVAQTIDHLIGLATPLKRFPLEAAQRYLEHFPDPDRQVVVDARRDEIERTTTALAVVLAIGLALGTWFWRWGSRRVVQRDRALAAHFNPFRQDSPNNPARTPFAATELVSELLRTLELNCVVVQGPELTGKSALLRHVAWRLESEGLAGSEVRVVRLELMSVPESQFWTVLGVAIAKAYPECDAGQEILDEELDRDAVEYLLDEALESGPRLVLVLDDLDTLGLYAHESQRFRGLIQIVPSHRMSVLGAGVNIRRGYGDHDESPWFNLFQVRSLRPMSEDELADYLNLRLQDPFTFEAAVPRRLHELTGGRALQVWHICSAAAEEVLVSRRVVLRVQDLEEAANALRDMAGVVVPGDDEAWEALLDRVAKARRKRDELLNQLAERRHQEQLEL